MKNFKYISILFIGLLLGCEKDDNNDTAFADNANAPQNLSALFTITQDNSGLVTINPNGEGVVSYDVYYGDSTLIPATMGIGEKTTHTYAEGTYNVKLIATGINGKKTEATVPLTVAFKAPENLKVTIAPVAGNPFKINVTATADYETYFEVWFGEDNTAAPEQFNEGTTISHTYSKLGTYTIKIVAYSGGVATSTFTQDVTINNPLLLPITFQDQTLNYAFGNFGNATTTVVDNPDATGVNTSTKVAKQVKSAGSEIWAGSLLTVDSPINNLATMHYFKVKVWSPKVGTVFKLKLENAANTDINIEVDGVTTVANKWEELTYNFTGPKTNEVYNNVVMFCNYGVTGSGDTYYFDDIIQTATGTDVGFPLTFEDASIDYTFTDFNGAASLLMDNPKSGTGNTSAKVMRVLKTNGADIYAGSFFLFPNAIDFTSKHIIKIKVWSPAAGTPVIVKFEKGSDANVNTEKKVVTTVANAWEELTFDFTGISTTAGYQRIVIFFNAGISGKGETYYFDDVELTN